jgi:hypothetical protein
VKLIELLLEKRNNWHCPSNTGSAKQIGTYWYGRYRHVVSLYMYLIEPL